MITDSNGTQYQSWGGNEATGIEISFFNKNPYDRDNFSPATEIKPNDSVSATVKFQTMYSGQPPTPGVCNIQLQLLLGHDLGSNRSTVSVENLTSKLSAN